MNSPSKRAFALFASALLLAPALALGQPQKFQRPADVSDLSGETVRTEPRLEHQHRAGGGPRTIFPASERETPVVARPPASPRSDATSSDATAIRHTHRGPGGSPQTTWAPPQRQLTYSEVKRPNPPARNVGR
jgi:hypothetical protein